MTDVALVPIVWIRTLAMVAAIAVVGVFFLGRCSAPAPGVARLQQGVTDAKAVRAAAIETVTVYIPRAAAAKAKAQAADSQVAVVDDTLLSVHLTPAAPPTIVIVPSQVTHDLITLRQTVSVQAQAIVALQGGLRADSVVIRRLDSLVAAQRPPRCGAKCGGAIALTVAGLIRFVAR